METAFQMATVIVARQSGPPADGGGPAMQLPPPAPIHGNPAIAVLVMTIIMTLIVGTKVYMKIFVLKYAGWDDLMALIGAGFVIALAGVIVSVFYDSGLIGGSASPAVIGAPDLANRLFVYLLLGAVPNGFAKLSILFLYLQLFPRNVRPKTAYLTYFGIAIVTLYYSINVLYTGIHCGPYHHVPCPVSTQVKLAKASACVNLVLDVYLMAIAVFNIWSLQMSTRYKIGVSLIFLTGVLALVCSIVTLYYRVATTLDPNAVWTQVIVPLVLVIYEPSIALITASLPATPSLWRRLSKAGVLVSARHLLSRLTGSSRSQGSLELTDGPSHENLGRTTSETSRARIKGGQDVYSAEDVQSMPRRG